MLLPLGHNFPSITGVRWFNLAVLGLTPAIAGYGLLVLPRIGGTMLFAMIYYVFSMLGTCLSPLPPTQTDSFRDRDYIGITAGNSTTFLFTHTAS